MQKALKFLARKVTLGKLKPNVPISRSQVMLLERITEILDFAEEGTRVLRAERIPTTHLHDFFISSSQQRCKYVKETTQPGTAAHIIAERLCNVYKFIVYRTSQNTQCSKLCSK